MSAKEHDRLVNEAMRITQSREDLLRRNDELLTKLMRDKRHQPRRLTKAQRAPQP